MSFIVVVVVSAIIVVTAASLELFIYCKSFTYIDIKSEHSAQHFPSKFHIVL